MKIKTKIILFMIIAVLLLNVVLPTIKVYAKQDEQSGIIRDTYYFTSNEENNIQLEDEFEYRDDCFIYPSTYGCNHLEILSAQVSEASDSWYGENEDKYEIDYSNNAHNIKDMLNKMKFEDVSTNKYYTLEKEENSAAVAVGHKTIKTNKGIYTLLAIIPRSAGYKQEWAGNFTVGDGNIHTGFKSARDEILRYVKEYIKDNNINGKLKVWTAGHSRGAAIANMIGGFFVGGGIEYFGDEVSITPSDVYCYTFATPRTIKDALDKNTELSVAGNRSEDCYKNDTPGEAFNYTKGGKVDLKDNEYKCIRNIISPYDIFPMLPPENWGFTRYGTDIPANHYSITETAMLNELENISNYAYNKYLNGGNPNTFERKTFDLKTLSIVKDNNFSSNMDVNTFLNERLNALTHVSTTNNIYVGEGYQEALKSVAGVYGMSMTFLDENFIEDKGSIITPLIYSYLSYVSERLQTEGIAEREEDAIAIALEELLTYFTGEEIDYDTFTFDDLLELLSRYITENEEEPIADTIISGIVNLIPEEFVFILDGFKQFDKRNKEEEVSREDGLRAYFKACCEGVDPECEAYSDYKEASEARNLFHTLLALALSINGYQDEANLIISNYGKIQLKLAVGIVLKIIKTVQDDDGNVVQTYSRLSEIADDKLSESIDLLFDKVLQNSENLYGTDYKNKFSNHLNTIKANISKVREILIYGMTYDNEGFSAVKDIKNLTTFIGNINIIPLAHYNEVYLAYAKASNNFESVYEGHIIEDTDNECIKGDGQTFNPTKDKNLTFVFTFDYDLFAEDGKIFIDYIEVPREYYTISKGSTVVTFNAEFVNTLSEGDHSIVAMVNGEAVEAEFKISNSEDAIDNKDAGKNESKKESNPKTGDNIYIYFTLMIISLTGMIVTVKLKNNK